jgi:hypothetical protein
MNEKHAGEVAFGEWNFCGSMLAEISIRCAIPASYFTVLRSDYNYTHYLVLFMPAIRADTKSTAIAGEAGGCIRNTA